MVSTNYTNSDNSLNTVLPSSVTRSESANLEPPLMKEDQAGTCLDVIDNLGTELKHEEEPIDFNASQISLEHPMAANACAAVVAVIAPVVDKVAGTAQHMRNLLDVQVQLAVNLAANVLRK